MNRQSTLLLGLAAVLLLSGCSMFSGPGYGTRTGTSSSLVDYLYPDGEIPPEVRDTVPQLRLPLRVGIAYVPGYYSAHDISEVTKMSLLEDVKSEFAELNYVDHIEVIPDIYLRSSNGVNGMQQVARMYGVDVMALVSYDQVSVSEENKAAVLYWTIVGAYFIDGNDTEVQTFVDTAVFDVSTAQLLFRAPGTDKSTGRSTLVESNEDVRKRSDTSFTHAVHTMTDNLAFELTRFEERAKNPDVVDVAWKEGHGGAGSSDGWLLLLLGLVAARAQLLRRDTPVAAHPRPASPVDRRRRRGAEGTVPPQRLQVL